MDKQRLYLQKHQKFVLNHTKDDPLYKLSWFCDETYRTWCTGRNGELAAIKVWQANTKASFPLPVGHISLPGHTLATANINTDPLPNNVKDFPSLSTPSDSHSPPYWNISMFPITFPIPLFLSFKVPLFSPFSSFSNRLVPQAVSVAQLSCYNSSLVPAQQQVLTKSPSSFAPLSFPPSHQINLHTSSRPV